MAVIAYDFPVKDYIEKLNATGHVTHTPYKKTSVTLHHNAGRLSHDGILKVWQTRPASAHFDVDSVGAVAQFVKVNEYAWACGNTIGNKSSIHIEMANYSLGPDWEIAPATWKSAARLTAWLFARVIGSNPTAQNVFAHHHWKSTACAGPFFDSIYSLFLEEVQRSYQEIIHPTPPPKPQLKLGTRGPQVTVLQRFLRAAFPAYQNAIAGGLISVDGIFGKQTEAWVKEFQRRTNLSATGIVDDRTRQRMARFGYKP